MGWSAPHLLLLLLPSLQRKFDGAEEGAGMHLMDVEVLH